MLQEQEDSLHPPPLPIKAGRGVFLPRDVLRGDPLPLPRLREGARHVSAARPQEEADGEPDTWQQPNLRRLGFPRTVTGSSLLESQGVALYGSRCTPPEPSHVLLSSATTRSPTTRADHPTAVTPREAVMPTSSSASRVLQLRRCGPRGAGPEDSRAAMRHASLQHQPETTSRSSPRLRDLSHGSTASAGPLTTAQRASSLFWGSDVAPSALSRRRLDLETRGGSPPRASRLGVPRPIDSQRRLDTADSFPLPHPTSQPDVPWLAVGCGITSPTLQRPSFPAQSLPSQAGIVLWTPRRRWSGIAEEVARRAGDTGSFLWSWIAGSQRHFLQERHELEGRSRSTAADSQRPVASPQCRPLVLCFPTWGAWERELVQRAAHRRAHAQRMTLLQASQEAAYMQLLAEGVPLERDCEILHVMGQVDRLLYEWMRHGSVAEALTPLPRQRHTALPAATAAGTEVRLELDAVVRDSEVFARLLPHQQEGVLWLLDVCLGQRLGAILADDMGLGKTAQSIAFLWSYAKVLSEPDNGPWAQQHHMFPPDDETAAGGGGGGGGGATSTSQQKQSHHQKAMELLARRKRGRPATETEEAIPHNTETTNAPVGCIMGPTLVTAPLSTLPHWEAEFCQFAGKGSFRIFVLNGSREARDERIQEFLKELRVLLAANAACGPKETGAPYPPQGTANGVDRGLVPLVVLAPHDMFARPLQGVQRKLATAVAWQTILVDEAHRMKNAQSAFFTKLSGLRSITRVVLTGTPLQNNVAELFALLQFLLPNAFHAPQAQKLIQMLDEALRQLRKGASPKGRKGLPSAAGSFSALSSLSDTTQGSSSDTTWGSLEDEELQFLLCRRVHGLLQRFLLRREKAILGALLPGKEEHTLFCPMMPLQQQRIEAFEQKRDSGQLSGNFSIAVRKILLHPYTLDPYFDVDEGMITASGKMLVLDVMMAFLRHTSHRFLIFSQWTLVLDVVESVCQFRGLPYVRLDGSTPAQTREDHIQRFSSPLPLESSSSPSLWEREGEEEETQPQSTLPSPQQSNTSTAAERPIPICFLVSKTAGGVGLNLQAADTVFLLDTDHNPQRDAQAFSRVYRVGQTRPVKIFRLLIDHPVERRIVEVSEAKAQLEAVVVQAGKFDLHSTRAQCEAALKSALHATTVPAGEGLKDGASFRSHEDVKEEDAGEDGQAQSQQGRLEKGKAAMLHTQDGAVPPGILGPIAEQLRTCLPRSEEEKFLLDRILADNWLLKDSSPSR